MCLRIYKNDVLRDLAVIDKYIDLLISKNENALFFGEEYISKKGIFTSKISKNSFNDVENSFKKSNITKLKDRYSSNWTDLNTISVTFIKGKKIIKTIESIS